MNKQISVSGSVNEWQVLVNLLDAAVKATGLAGAKAAVIWTERIQKTVNDSEHTQQVEISPPSAPSPSPGDDIPF